MAQGSGRETSPSKSSRTTTKLVSLATSPNPPNSFARSPGDSSEKSHSEVGLLSRRGLFVWRISSRHCHTETPNLAADVNPEKPARHSSASKKDCHCEILPENKPDASRLPASQWRQIQITRPYPSCLWTLSKHVLHGLMLGPPESLLPTAMGKSRKSARVNGNNMMATQPMMFPGMGMSPLAMDQELIKASGLTGPGFVCTLQYSISSEPLSCQNPRAASR